MICIQPADAKAAAAALADPQKVSRLLASIFFQSSLGFLASFALEIVNGPAYIYKHSPPCLYLSRTNYEAVSSAGHHEGRNPSYCCWRCLSH